MSRLRDRRTRRKATKPHDRGAVRKRADQTALAKRLVSSDLVNLFVDNFKRTVDVWVELLRETTPDSSVSSIDPRRVSAFEILDGIITGWQGTYLLRRLTYIQYKRMSDSLERIVESERETGAPHNSGVGDATVVMNIVER